MEIVQIEIKPNPLQDKKLSDAYAIFEKLITELRKRTLPEDVIHSVNWLIEQVNSFKGSDKDLIKQLKASQTSILKIIEKDLKLVPKAHYQNTWLVLGMTTFGIPIGVAIGLISGNMGLLGMGFPIGMVIGIVWGTAMDQKAKEKGNQLDVKTNC